MKHCKEASNCQQTGEYPVSWPFWLELALATLIPLIIWWRITPTNILNSNALWKVVQVVGIGGSMTVLFAGIPVGIIGIRAARKMVQLRVATKVISIINLCAGIMEVATMLLIFCAVVFGGVSV